MRDLLEAMVSRLGMRLLGAPHLYEVEEEISKLNVEPFEDEGGVTGVAVLSTSHCAIHTWPQRNFFVLDVYSCRDFEPEAVRQLLGEYFGAYALRLSDLSHSLVPTEEALVTDLASEDFEALDGGLTQELPVA